VIFVVEKNHDFLYKYEFGLETKEKSVFGAGEKCDFKLVRKYARMVQAKRAHALESRYLIKC